MTNASPTLVITPETPVGQIVAAQPLLAKVFEHHRIDYCCGGKLALGVFCAKKGIDAQALIAELQAAMDTASAPESDWTQATLTALVGHIVETHHAYMREAVPRLLHLSQKVARVHGDNHPELIEVASIYQAFNAEITAHMEKEELILFPAILRLEAGVDRFPVNNPIRVMEAEHDSAGRDFERMRALTNDFTPPEDGCNSYRALFAGLEEMELDLFSHIHKENNILFPRAIALLDAPAKV